MQQKLIFTYLFFGSCLEGSLRTSWIHREHKNATELQIWASNQPGTLLHTPLILLLKKQKTETTKTPKNPQASSSPACSEADCDSRQLMTWGCWYCCSWGLWSRLMKMVTSTVPPINESSTQLSFIGRTWKIGSAGMWRMTPTLLWSRGWLRSLDCQEKTMTIYRTNYRSSGME